MTDTATEGCPLAADVVRMIHARHEARVPPELRGPSNGLTPIVRGHMAVVHAYSPKDGRHLGSMAESAIRDHAAVLVLLDSRRVPTVEELQAIRVTDDGRVVMP